MIKTDVFATDGTEICDGDRIEIILPSRSIYKGTVLARGVVFFSHGSFRVRKEDAHVSDTPRLDDFSPDCVINILNNKP